MSLFGQPAQGQQSGGLFGAVQQPSNAFGQPQNTQQGSSLFANLGQQPKPQQQSGGLFGHLGGASTQQQSTGLFGNTTNQPQQPQQGGGLFGNTMNQNQQPQNQQGGGLFGNTMNQQQQNQQGGGLFGNSQQQQLQQQQPQGSLFGNPQRQQTNSIWPSNSPPTREKSVPDQMKTVLEKWHIGSPDCAFQHYFYNKVGEQQAPLYQPNPNEDPKAWEEALGKKPGLGYIPVLCTGFAQLGERIQLQAHTISLYNRALHDTNEKLSRLLQDHETKHSIRALDAKRKHAVLRQRCLRIATKVQVLRNRGYALGGDEEDLRTKLQELEKKANDPGLGARAEEIWARMLTVQERAKVLKSEIEKSGGETPDMLDEETIRKAKKILEDYDRQLVHLKKELDTIQKEYVEWETSQKADAEAAAAYGRSSIR